MNAERAASPQGPERIWLQDCGDSHEGLSLQDITWCADQIGDDDTEYIRADIHRAELSAAREQVADLTNALQMEADRGKRVYEEQRKDIFNLAEKVIPNLKGTHEAALAACRKDSDERKAKIKERIAELDKWVTLQPISVKDEQAHLNEHSMERLYWHYGYLMALRDLDAMSAQGPT